MLSYQLEPKLQAFSGVNDAIVATHMKIFRYVSWASNSVSKNLLDALYHEIETDLSGLSYRIGALSRRTDLSAEERTTIEGLLTRWEKCKSQAKDTIDVGRTDAPMATMMLGQTDDSFKAVDADIQKMSITTTEAANAVQGRALHRRRANQENHHPGHRPGFCGQRIRDLPGRRIDRAADQIHHRRDAAIVRRQDRRRNRPSRSRR